MKTRPLEQSDYDIWHHLWQEYLVFYEVELPDHITQTTWQRLFDPAHPLTGIVCEDESGEVVGAVHYHFHVSTWSIAPYCYLEDLFVNEKARGNGAGRALIEAVRKEAEKQNSGRLYWHTNAENKRAQALYNKVAENKGFIRYDVAL